MKLLPTSSRSGRRLGVALLLAFVGLPAQAAAQADDWDVVFAPYGMFASLTGEAAIGPGSATPLDLSFGDLVRNLEVGGMLHAEAWKGGWGVLADLVFMRLGSDISTPFGGVVDIEVNEVVAEGLLGRRFEGPTRQIDVFGGIRFWDLGLDVELVDTPAALDLGDSWVDPVVGGRLVQDLTDAWFLILRGDVGGFGVGSSFSWNALGGIGYEVSSLFSVVAQYRALGVDFQNDKSGLDALSYDTTTHGPLIGFVFRF